MIGIRVDVNSTVATGHIMRDLSIARCLRELGEEVLFLSADDNCIPYLEPEHFPYLILQSEWEHLEKETDQLLQILREYPIRSLLVDSYYVTAAYMQALSRSTKVTYFDELYRKGFGCQQLINGVLEPPDYSDYRGHAFLGPAYVALRKEFSDLAPKKISHVVKKILVTSGGTDNYHFSRYFLERFLQEREWEDTEIILVIGNLCVDKEELIKRYGNNIRVALHVNTGRMAELMQESDYAITAGGTTLYEICASGVAASSFVIGDNQLEVTHSFDRLGYIAYAGDFRRNAEATYRNILKHLRMAAPKEYRSRKAECLQRLVDGKGADRIARLLREGNEAD